MERTLSKDKHGSANTELSKTNASLNLGENEQLFHPTITTGIAPMAVLIYMNAAIFAGESKGLHVVRRLNRRHS